MYLAHNLKTPLSSVMEFEMQLDIFVSWDADKMQRVFDNLLRNAVSYCSADTSIKIIAEQIENHGQITAHSADSFTCFEVSLPLVGKS